MVISKLNTHKIEKNISIIQEFLLRIEEIRQHVSG